MSKRKAKLQAEIGSFMRQYQRKAHAGHDPNDRGYSRKMEAKLKRMRPEELDELLHGDLDDSPTPARKVSDETSQGVPRRGF